MHLQKLFLFVISASLFSQFLFSQPYNSIPSIDQKIKKVFVNNKPGHLYTSFTFKDTVIVSDVDMTEMIDVIVEFKEPPLFVQMLQSGLKKINMSSFLARQTQFSSKLSSLQQTAEKVYNAKFEMPQKNSEFFKLFNGVSIRIPRAMLSDVASLDYVKKVHPAKTFSVNYDESIHIVGADAVWANYKNQGDSIVVGVIDTGIDYLHPAFGSGFGKGFKVIGGYDFVNKDADPMDDHSHGTHVAGIIAGKKDIMWGIAPNALLMAFKVMDKNGHGIDADVIAGIERALDPNDDNNFDDKVDIVNMSLGGDGSPDDPVSTAVNNAVKLGVTFCVAAGNSSGYGTIGSPAMAEQAITVGATDKSDKIAGFSSKGPNPDNFAIKPDVLAPGVSINSTLPGNAYGSKSGTSMSSPMVAGVCALLKREHKDWTPQMIKSAIMSSAKDLGLDVMAQGAGRVQAPYAIIYSSFASPASLSFGLDNLNVDVWSKKDTVTIINRFTDAQDYNIKISGLASGFSLVPSVSSFSLLPGQSTQIIFSLDVNNKTISDVQTPPYSFYGTVTVSGTKDILRIPWAFSKLSSFNLAFNKPPAWCFIFNEYNQYMLYDTSKNSDFYNIKLVIPSGKYKVLVNFSKLSDLETGLGEMELVLKDSVNVKGYFDLNINSNEAVNKIEFKGVDESGRLLTGRKNSINNLIFKFDNTYSNNEFNFDLIFSTLFTLPGKVSVKCSEVSDNILIKAGQYQGDAKGEHIVRAVQYPVIKGLRSDFSFSNKPADFLNQNISISLSPIKKETNAYFMNTVFCGNYSLQMGIAEDVITERNWLGKLFLTKETNDGFVTSVGIGTDTASSDPFNENTFMVGILRTSGDSSGSFDISLEPDREHMYPQNSLLQFGNGVICPHISFYGTEKGLNLGYYSIGQLNEYLWSDKLYSTCDIYDSQDKLIFSDSLSKLNPINLPQGKYNFVVKKNNYFINGIGGNATLLFNLKVTDDWIDPPSLISLRVLNSNRIPVSNLKKGEKGTVDFAIPKSNLYLSDYSVFLKKHDSPNWKKLILIGSKEINSYHKLITADMADITDTEPGKIDLKIILNNNSNLKYELILEPAFIVGDYVENDSTEIANMPKQFALHSNYPNPFNPSTMIRYELPRQSLVELKVFDVLGREIKTLVNQLQNAGIYNTPFDASKLSSGVYFYTIKAGGYTNSKKMLLIK